MSIAGQLLAAFFILCAGGAVIAFLLPPRWISVVLGGIASLASLILLLASALMLMADSSFHADLWSVLSLGTLSFGADRLSALFLFVTSLVLLPVSIFSATYLIKYLKHYSLRYFSLLYYALFASIVLVLISDDTISFLVAWEFMSIVSYLLVNYEYEREESSHAGFVMLAMSEAGNIAVAIAFILVAGAAGALGFDKLRAAAPTLVDEIRWAVFLLSFFGFAVKAGLVPVNSWLPLAHPVAPTNVSALLSAVIVNLGIYGIIPFQHGPCACDGEQPGPDSPCHRQPLRPDRNPVRHRTIGDEATAGAQHHREHGHCRGGYWSGHDLLGHKSSRGRSDRAHRCALSSRQPFRVQGAALCRNRNCGSRYRYPRSGQISAESFAGCHGPVHSFSSVFWRYQRSRRSTVSLANG